MQEGAQLSFARTNLDKRMKRAAEAVQTGHGRESFACWKFALDVDHAIHHHGRPARLLLESCPVQLCLYGYLSTRGAFEHSSGIPEFVIPLNRYMCDNMFFATHANAVRNKHMAQLHVVAAWSLRQLVQKPVHRNSQDIFERMDCLTV